MVLVLKGYFFMNLFSFLKAQCKGISNQHFNSFMTFHIIYATKDKYYSNVIFVMFLHFHKGFCFDTTLISSIFLPTITMKMVNLYYLLIQLFPAENFEKSNIMTIKILSYHKDLIPYITGKIV